MIENKILLPVSLRFNGMFSNSTLRYTFIIILLAFSACNRGSLPVSLDNADLLFTNKNFYDAAKMYTKLYPKEKVATRKAHIANNCAESYYQMADYLNALKWIEKDKVNNISSPTQKLRYCKLLISDKQFDAALAELAALQKEIPGNKKIKEFQNICDLAKKINVDGSSYKVEIFDEVNTSYNDYSPFMTANAMYFTSDRVSSTGEVVSPWTNTFTSDIFIAKKDGEKFDKAVPMAKEINSVKSEGVHSFNAAANLIMYTKCNDVSFDSSCAIVFNKRERGNWLAPQTIPFSINSKYIFGQPTLSNDGKTLIFVSDMPGGEGGHDLWISTMKAGKWQRPVNMGSKINSSGDEMFPVLHEDNTLFFSSNGHGGFGGLDLFKAININGKWRKPSNMLLPVNSGGDDFGLCFDPSDKTNSTGYFSSNRPGSEGDDIYKFTISTPPLSTICGTVYDKKTKKPLANSKVYLQEIGKELPQYVITDENGYYCMKLLYDKKYKLDAFAPYYVNNASKPQLSTLNLQFQKQFEADFHLDKWTISEIKLEGIYYDVDKAEIRKESEEILDSLSTLLKIHDYLVVELASHTDCRASMAYNLDLSQRRAQTCVDFLVSKGIENSRLIAKGYGESKLLNDCACEGEEGKGIDCSEAEHQLNRRTTFKIIRTDFETKSKEPFGVLYTDPESDD